MRPAAGAGRTHAGDLPLGLTPVRNKGALLRDPGMCPLVERVAQRLQRRLGQRPCVVAARVSRRFLGAHRRQADAMASDTALPADPANPADLADALVVFPQARGDLPRP